MKKIYIYTSIAVLLLSSILGCDNKTSDTTTSEPVYEEEQLPDNVYVATKNVKSVVIIKAVDQAEVGDWVKLSATRETTGNWILVKRTELKEDEQWYTSPRNGFENEVASNLSWEVEPSDNYEFDVASFQNINSMDRKVKFKKPGVYKLRGYSAYPLRTISNTIEIKVK